MSRKTLCVLIVLVCVFAVNFATPLVSQIPRGEFSSTAAQNLEDANVKGDTGSTGRFYLDPTIWDFASVIASVPGNGTYFRFIPNITILKGFLQSLGKLNGKK